MYKCFIGCLIILYSCNSNSIEKQAENSFVAEELSYAKRFLIGSMDKEYSIDVLNPWQSSKNIKYNYLFGTNGKENRSINIPVKRIICFSTSHIGFISMLREQNSIIGFSGIKYITDSISNKLVFEQRIVDVGYEESLNYELILSLKPDLILVYGVENEKVGYLTKLEELGLPVVFVAEYLEDTPLAKAEWIKFFGILYDKKGLADSIFISTEKEYNNIKMLAASYNNKPTVFSGLPWKDSWFVSGGQSYLSNFIRDAGGSYIWNEDSSHESFPLNLERVFERAADADIWINSGTANSLNEIKELDERLCLFKAFAKSKVYNNNRRNFQSMGNDYWESGVVQPQFILKDLVEIFHPGSFPEYELHYYKHLE